MNYSDTIQWMFSQLPMYQSKGDKAYKKDLTNSLKLSEYLDFPQKNFKAIHIAGTNGKGSTSHMLASIFQEAGYVVGLYTSPHFKDFRERIKINGKDITKQFVIGFIKRNQIFLKANSLSFFEMTVGMAFDYFSIKKVDIAIIETGLGGRLDSTNIINPLVSAITNIGLDHCNYLGNTIKAIALEKAGIIKHKTPVVIGESHSESKNVFKDIASRRQSKIYFADALIAQPYPSGLEGDYQQKNIKTVIQTIKIIRQFNFKLSKNNIKEGLINVVSNTGILGRWQIIGNKPKIICDIAHNEDGLSLVLNQLKQENYNTLHIVLGFVKGKAMNTIIKLFPKRAIYYFCKPSVERGMDAHILSHFFFNNQYKGQVYTSVIEAFNRAKMNAQNRDCIYVGGSTFVVAEVL